MEKKQTEKIEESLEEKVKEQPPIHKIALVDTLGNITYSLIVGSGLDYYSGLRKLTGILASRSSATAINSVTGGPYGWWREKVCRMTKTTEKSNKIRKGLANLLAFNTFQVPIYATAVAIGSLVSQGYVDWEKVKNGAINLAKISPFIGPTMGWYMDGVRKLFGVKSAEEGAYCKRR